MSDWPRVSDILASAGLGPDYSMVPAAVLERARERGSAVHRLIEAEHYGYAEDGAEDPELRPYLEAYRLFATESQHEPIRSEFTVEHPTWCYIGHPDRVGWMLGRRVLLDWKTAQSIDVRPAAFQLAGYRMAWNEMNPAEKLDACAVVQLRADATYRFHEIDMSPAEPVFLAAITVWWARREMER